MSTPPSSFIVKSLGPTIPAPPPARSQSPAASSPAALVVHREVHRADHPVTPAGAEPVRRGLEQRREDLRVVLELEEAEQPPRVAVVGVERAVDLSADPPGHPPVAASQEEPRLAV